MDFYDLKSYETFLVSQKAFIVNNGKLLILKFPKNGGKEWNGKWCLPGGLLEMKEIIRDGLIREVKEETGLTVIPKRILSIADFTYDGFIFKDGRKLKARIIQLGFVCKYNGGEVVISDEHIEYKWAIKSQLKRLKFTPDSMQLIEDYFSS